MFLDFFRPAVIIGSLPVTLTNGTIADANQVMSDLNFIVNQVNANAAPLATAALTNANNNFSVAQSGVNATSRGNFPLAGQVQDGVFNTLTSTLGTNTITARVSAMPLSAYAAGQIFTFVPSQTNTGPANITVDAAGSSIIFSGGATLTGGELVSGVEMMIARDSSRMNIIGSPYSSGSFVPNIIAGSGAFTSVSAIGTFVKIGRLVNFSIIINITTNGTAGTYVGASLPFSVFTQSACYGREDVLTGFSLIGSIVAGTNTLTVFKYDNTYPGADGRRLVVAGQFLAQ